MNCKAELLVTYSQATLKPKCKMKFALSLLIRNRLIQGQSSLQGYLHGTFYCNSTQNY